MKKKINKPNGRVRCYACFVKIPLWDSDDPDTVVLNHRISSNCIFSFPLFKYENKDDLKRFKDSNSKKKTFKKKKNVKKNKVAHFKKSGINK